MTSRPPPSPLPNESDDWQRLDLNLLRLFDAVYRLGSVSRAAEALGLSQPAASQGLARLRLLWHDALFERAGNGVRPTPRAQALAVGVGAALVLLRDALANPGGFDPKSSSRRFALHMSDLGEVSFLPRWMAVLQSRAPAVQLQVQAVPVPQLADALHSGRLDLAVGFFPELQDTCQHLLLRDRYGVAVRATHPVVRAYRAALRREDHEACAVLLAGLHYVAVRSHRHAMELMRVARLEGQVRLNTEHFMVLPALVRHSDLAVVVPHQVVAVWDQAAHATPAPPPANKVLRSVKARSAPIAGGRSQAGGHALAYRSPYAVLPWPRVASAGALANLTVAVHWSRRVDADPGHRWLRTQLFSGAAHAHSP